MNTICVLVEATGSPASIFDYIPQVVTTDDTRYVISTTGSADTTFHDVLVRAMVSERPIEPFKMGKDVMGKPYAIFNRMNKHSQQLVLDRYAKIANVSNYRHIDTIRQKEFNSIRLGAVDLIIKPDNGARSVGQIIITYAMGAPHGIYELVISSAGEQEFIDALNNNYPNVVYLKGDARYEGEGYHLLKQGMICQERVMKIADEFRIITDESGMDCISIKRRREVVDSETPDYAIPSKIPSAIDYSALEDSYPKVQAELRKLLRALRMPFHSLDVFVTSAGQWGVFEFSPDFSSAEYGPHVLPDLGIKFLKLLTAPDSCWRAWDWY